MNPLSITKAVVGIATSIGVGTVIGNAVRATTPATLTTIQKVTIGIGTFVVGGVISDLAVKQTNRMIDEAAATFREARKGIKEVKKTIKEATE